MLSVLLNAGAELERTSRYGEDIVLFVFFTLFIGTLTRHLSKEFRLNIPYTVMLLVIGVIWGALEFAIQGNLGRLGSAIESMVRINPVLLFLLFLPALIFESAFSVNPHIMQRELGQALLLAVPGLLIATALTAIFAKYVFVYDWSWNICFMFGAILSATDPVAVVALLRELGSSKRLATLIEAESLLNDGSSVVVYIIMLDRVLGNFKPPEQVLVLFMRLSLGGFLLGITGGILAAFWLRKVYRDPLVEISITVFTAYLAFWVAESVGLEVSGVLTCVFLGLYLASFKTEVSPEVESAMENVWHMISFVANTLLFVLSGAIVADKIFQAKYRFLDYVLLVALYVVLHLIRGLMVLMLAPLIRKLGYGLTWGDGSILVFSGLRGAIALALALKTDLVTKVDDHLSAEISDLILFHVSGIVLLTLLINATVLRYVLKALGKDNAVSSSGPHSIFRRAAQYVELQTSDLLSSMAHDRYFRGADMQRIRSQLPAFLNNCADYKDTGECDRQDTIISQPVGDHAGLAAMERARTHSMAPPPAIDVTPTLARMMTNSIGGRNVGTAEFRHVFLLAMRAAFHELFEEGVVSSSATRLLIESCEQGLDEDDFREQWQVIEPLLSLPRWLDHAYNIRPLRPLLRSVMLKRLSLSVELVSAYIRGFQNASQHIMETFEDVSMEGAFLRVRAELNQFVSQASARWLRIQVRYRDLHRSIQARNLAEYVLNREHNLVKSLYQKGILEEGVYQRMSSMVDDRIRQLHRSLALGHGITESVHDKFHNADLIRLLPHSTRSLLLRQSTSRVLEQDETLFNSFDPCNCVFVVTHGVLLVEHPGLADETAASGTVLGLYEALMETPFLATAVAVSDAEVAVLSIETLRKVMQQPSVSDTVWEFAGQSLALSTFFRPFLPRRALSVSTLVQAAHILTPVPNAVVDLQAPALLLKGSASFEMRPDGRQHPDAIAPALLLPSFRLYRFSDDCKILQFSQRWDLPYSDVVIRSASFDLMVNPQTQAAVGMSRARSLPYYPEQRLRNKLEDPTSFSDCPASIVELARCSTFHPTLSKPSLESPLEGDKATLPPTASMLPESCTLRPRRRNTGECEVDEEGSQLNPLRYGGTLPLSEKPCLARTNSMVLSPEGEVSVPMLRRCSSMSDVNGRD